MGGNSMSKNDIVYTLDFKIKVIKEILKEINREQKEFINDRKFWEWKQAEKLAYMTALDILEDDMDLINQDILDIVAIGRKKSEEEVMTEKTYLKGLKGRN
jgi:hypothetical protein